MRLKSPSGIAALLLVFSAFTLGLAACGSGEGESESGSTGSDAATKPADAAGTTGKSGDAGNRNAGGGQDPDKQGGEVIPGRNAPDSARDRNGKAPDDGISRRPGGPE